jgi:glycosyltransferase involved in cell wall biosynthesis
MPELVTVGIPVYKRLQYLPQALSGVQKQDYPNIELVVSDNGINGKKVTHIIDKFYARPYRLRENAASVSAVVHFNQIIQEATGKYFVLLSDDDEISANYISQLVNIMEDDPQVAIAFSRQELIDEGGQIRGSSKKNIPPIMSGQEFIRAWCSYTLGFKCFLTNMSRLKDIRLCGGFPDFPMACHSDNALVLKLCLNRYVAFSQTCTFRYRVHESSLGISADYKDVAGASKQFLNFLDSDPKILEFASIQPDLWYQSKERLTKMIWRGYLWRWKRGYRKTLPPWKWIRAAVVLPFIPAYYRAVVSTLTATATAAAFRRVKERLPWMYKIYQALRQGTV